MFKLFRNLSSVFAIAILLSSCSKDVDLTPPVVDFRDTLVGNFSTTYEHSHPTIDSLGNFIWINEYTYNYPISIAKYDSTKLRVRFGSLPDTISRIFEYIDELEYWDYLNHELVFVNKDSIKIFALYGSNAYSYFGHRVP